ncbi:MAG: VOC family protein [Phycisphaeraceae bacterium]|nr:MAG: VOC family protein [Phycisphaeraceae bacterium]
MTVVLLAAAGCQTTRSTIAQDSANTPRVTPFLMFQDGRAEEAINRYIEVFGDGRIVFLQRFGSNPVGAPEDSIQHAAFEIYGQLVMVTESPIKHPFEFTPAVSLFVDFDSAAELDRVFEALSEDGFVMMPLGDYGFSERFAFIQDRYGVSWQLNLPSE